MKMLQTILISLLVITSSNCTPSLEKDEAQTTIDKTTIPIVEEQNETTTLEVEVEPSVSPSLEENEITPSPARKGKNTSTKTPNSTPVKKEVSQIEKEPPHQPEPTKNPISEKVKTTIPQPEIKTTEPKTREEPIENEPTEEKETILTAPNHAAWDALLRQYVNSQGKVNYKGFKSDKAKLDAYLKTLASNPIQNSWSRNEKLAYWINVYNAYTIKLIVDNYPVSSITKLKGGKPWDVKWIKLGTKTYSLNQIENEIIRPQFKESRIHFAVNCAALSCPPLLNRAWTANNLNANFERQAKAFINNPKYNKISATKVQVSKIFDWYGEDFGNLIDYLNKYSDTKIRSNAKVSYLEYDWALNQ